jgi:hypothetical protein
MQSRTRLCWSATLAPVYALIWSGLAQGQQPLAARPGIEEQTRKNAASPCLEPPPLVSLDQYQGPFQKLVGAFGRTLERKSATQPHYKPGTLLCSLEPKDKFILFAHDAFDPLSLLGAGFFAGIDQAQNRDPTFGQGSEGYGKRFGVALAGQTSFRFFSDFAYPTMFSEDPRYYRLAHGSAQRRLLHAVEHTFVAYHDDGNHMFNYSEWMGAATAVAVSDGLHPGNEHGFGAAAKWTSFAVMTDMGLDVLREFWPEIARKLKMPFSEKREPQTDSRLPTL